MAHTDIIERPEGATLREYIVRSARMMAPCYDQRDEPMDAPLRVPSVPSYYADLYADLTEERKGLLAQLVAMTDEEVRAAWQVEVEKIEKYNRESAVERTRILLAYKKMRIAVERWELPYPAKDYEALKKVMLDGIDEGVEHASRDFSMKAPPTPGDWRSKQIESTDIAYYERKYAEEQQAYAKNATWVATLMKSLP